MIPRDPSREASDPSRSAWVSANAGAGKTHTLANRVTRLLLADAAPQRILCLTYTKAAAAEMAGRLFDQLGKWAMAPDDKLAKYIADVSGETKNKEELKKARRLFALALETPGGLKIQTIHAFCQNLLSRFPLEASVPPAFRVLDDQTSRELIASARSAVLERAGSGDVHLAAATATLVTHTSESRLHDILDAALGGDRRNLERCLATLCDSDGSRTKVLRRAHGAHEDKNEHDVAAEFSASLRAHASELEEAVDWLAQGAVTDKGRSDRLRQFLAMDFAPEGFEVLQRVFLTGAGKPCASLATKGVAAARPDLAAFLDTLSTRFCAAEEHRLAARSATLCDAAVTLAAAVTEEYRRQKSLRGMLDYDDLIQKTLNLLKRSGASAWVLYRLDGGLDHVLIDEAQDTSPEQWEILRILTEEFFGEGVRTLADKRTVFAVGDEKQSIFSFQGADPAQFEINRRHFHDRVVAFGEEFAFEELVSSRRSLPRILQFVDKVFAEPSAREGLTSEGKAIHHEAVRKENTGRVEFWPSLKPDKTPVQDPWLPVDIEPKNSPVVRLAQRLATEIHHWLSNKIVLPGHDAPIRPGDIMILLPRREPFGSEIIRQLKIRGVPVAGADRIKITEQIAVMDLIALGRFALLPQDDLTLAAILRSPLGGLSEDELFELCRDRPGTVWSALSAQNDRKPQFAATHRFLTETLARADFAPPYEFFAHILIEHGMRKRLLARLGAEANDAIDEFLSLALSYETLNVPSLEGFLHWIERGGAEIKRDMERGRDEVRVMTVHGAKGLEADIVILPDTTRPPPSAARGGSLLYTEDAVLFPVSNENAPEAVRRAKEAAKQEILRENRRLLYVALTRARDRLYICGFENKRGVDPESWYALASEAALAIGKEVVRGGETIHVIGNTDEDRRADTLPAPAAAPTPLPGWVTKPPAPEPTGPRLLRPSDLLDDEPPVFSPQEPKGAKRFQRGVLVHALLARLPEIAPDERAKIARHFLDMRGVATEDAEALIEETIRVLNDPVFAPVFAQKSRAEVALVAELPELGVGVTVNGRVDRLAAGEDSVLVVDFKTNRPPPKIEADVAMPYIRQMALYRLALQKIFAPKPVTCGLVWTDGPRLLLLSDALLDSAIVRLMARPASAS